VSRYRTSRPSALLQHDFRRVAEVIAILTLHRAGESLVLDGNVELVVPDEAREIEVRRAHPGHRPSADGSLGVHHRPVPLEDTNAGLEKGTVSDREKGERSGMSLAPGTKETHVDGVAGCRAEAPARNPA
jgi:hypothetical protein